MITIISSTNRNNSYTGKVAHLYRQFLNEQNIECRLFALTDLPEDFIFSNFNGRKNEKYEMIIDEFIIPAQKFIFIIPEYNGSFPGILKAMIDTIHPKNFHGKKAALVGVADGRSGGLRALDDFSSILNHIRVNVYWDKPKLSEIDKHFHGDTLDEAYTERMRRQVNEFIKF